MGIVMKLSGSCEWVGPTSEDVIVILGDAGLNYYGNNYGDRDRKKKLNKLGVPIFCIHGNHEMRPGTIPSYQVKEWNGGSVWYEEKFPNLLFAKDGEVFEMDGLAHLIFGGAYSVDKYVRLMRGFAWWPDEQPSDEIKAYVEKQVQEREIDVVLSHTCPHKYEPVEMFIPGVDQSKVDKSTELWLDRIEETVDYKQWLCGHWHINKRVDRMQFLYHDFICSEDLKNRMSLFGNEAW